MLGIVEVMGAIVSRIQHADEGVADVEFAGGDGLSRVSLCVPGFLFTSSLTTNLGLERVANERRAGGLLARLNLSTSLRSRSSMVI